MVKNKVVGDPLLSNQWVTVTDNRLFYFLIYRIVFIIFTLFCHLYKPIFLQVIFSHLTPTGQSDVTSNAKLTMHINVLHKDYFTPPNNLRTI